ncbi:PAS domain-containing protein [bacterium]|nr:PAS domain-containing protein [bacterium]
MEPLLIGLLGAVLGAAAAAAGCYLVSAQSKRRRLAKFYRRASSPNVAVPVVTADPRTSDYLDHVESECSRLMQDEQRLKAILDALSEGLALIDRDLRVSLCNPAFATMFRSREGESLPLGAIHEDSRSDFRRAVDATLATRAATSVELRLTTTPPRDVFVTLTPYEDEALSESVIFTAFDVTQRKRVEAMRSEFVANVSHELRTPLAAIRGYVETCLESAADGSEPPYERFLPIIHQHAMRLNALIEDLLILSRIESKGMQLNIQPLALAGVVENTIATLAPAAEKKRVALINALPPLLPSVKADASSVERILINLVENAIKYSEGDSEVTITARLQADSVCVLISDQGVGIPREDQQRIFERFYRVDKARSRKAGGTGLGLSIVKHLVQAHGGEVWVNSEVGRGSTFFFTLRLAGQSEREPSAVALAGRA